MKKVFMIMTALIFIVPVMATADRLPESDEFVEVDKMPEMIKSTPPVYPEAEKKAGIEGEVLIKALIDKTGKVVQAEVAKSSGNEALDKAAVDAAYQNAYNPALQGDQPVAVWVGYVVKFTLEEKDKKGP